MNRRLLELGCFALVLAGTPFRANAAPVSSPLPERLSTGADQENVNVTIYNGSFSLIHDRRRVTLDAGRSDVAWRDVSGTMDATSAILQDLSLPGSVSVIEQNFDFDLLRPAALLDKYVGQPVTVVHEHPAPGTPASETATLLANNDGIVLRYPDRIETSLVDSHIVYSSIPANLRDRPTLVLAIESKRAVTHELDLSYLANGLGWHAEYVGVVSPDETRMDLSGLVTLTNATGTTFANAHVQLVAGNVNVPPVAQFGAQLRVMARASMSNVRQENFFEYHLYTLATPTTIANAQTKQVALLSARGVPIRKTLEVRGSPDYYTNENADLGDKIPVGVYLTFTNKGGDLGIPLPGGLVRLYKTDSAGTSQFLGSDRIDHTPKNEDVRLHLGDSFDVTAKKTQTDFKIVGACVDESAYALRLANAKEVAQDVEVIEPIPGDWTMVAESLPHRQSSSSTSTWTVHVTPGSSTTLTYRVRTKYC